MEERPSECTREEEITQIEIGAPHVVILGAGASLAACPTGDRNGKQLPVMKNFVKTLNLSGILKKTAVDLRKRNFEEIYDQLYKDEKHFGVRQELEDVIYRYFSSMLLPDYPTIYDHLVLSLREKDVIATFNWDPLLTQAYKRNPRRYKKPKLLFLHGNVTIGYCEKDNITGINGNVCSQCGIKLTPSKLLYPVQEKDYHRDGFISGEWKELVYAMKHAFWVTIFGYGAPKSDLSAIELLREGWGDKNKRSMEQTEIIDIKPEKTLRLLWNPFIHTHHYEVHSNFYDSWISNHPRGTGEAYLNQYCWARFIEDNPIPQGIDFPELWKWFDKLHEVEAKHSFQREN
jgi:hypothetical protein